jgi:hypothetical protein
MSTGLKANPDGSAAIQVGGTDVITLTSGGAATFVTSPTTVQAGTAAAPSITTSGDTNTGIFFPAADTIAFAEGGAEALRINSSGTVVLSGGDTSANGTGITFPATQSASSNANTLDDYEEGSFDPTVTADTPPTGVTYNGRVGRFVKIGKMVQVEISIELSNKGTGGSGGAYIGNLPFTSATVGGHFPNFGIGLAPVTAAVTGQVTGQINTNDNKITLVNNTNTTGALSAMAYSSITNSTCFRTTFVYQAAN